MSDEATPDLRWLVERNHAETRDDIADLKAQIAGIPAAMDRYVLQRVYEAERDADRSRIKRLEDHDTTQAAGGRAWMIGIGLAVVGGVCGYISQVMQARGR